MLRRIGFYLCLWGLLFLALCVISLIRHWDLLIQRLGNQLMGVAVAVLPLVCIAAIVWSLLRSLF